MSRSNSNFGERLNSIFTSAGGSNFYEHHPLSFKAEGEKAERDPKNLRADYVALFAAMASSTFGTDYILEEIPTSKDGKLTDLKIPIIKPAKTKVSRAGHVYFFNQWTFEIDGESQFPLIDFSPVDMRRSKEHGKNESSVFLRFKNSPLAEKVKLFNIFEQAIEESGIPYERHHPKKELESLDFDLEFTDTQYRTSVM